jgi:hypothetical protein
MRIVCLFIGVFICTAALTQQTYWQQYLRYDINAELNDKREINIRV